jgi:hypothetical protein
MTTAKESGQGRNSLTAQQRNNDTDPGITTQRKQRRYSDWLADSRQYRRAAINRQSWIGSEEQ